MNPETFLGMEAKTYSSSKSTGYDMSVLSFFAHGSATSDDFAKSFSNCICKV